MRDESNGLDIPESNREIALHLLAIKLQATDVKTTLNSRLDNLEIKVDSIEQGMNQRRFRAQDMLFSSLILPLVGGMLLFLLTKALG